MSACRVARLSTVALLIATLVVAALLDVSCRTSERKAEIERVVLISIDTCRADYLSCYGYKHQTTPNIDALAAEGILFENVVTPAPLTLPAHSSMLTGTTPLYHGVHNNLDNRLGSSNVTLAELLKPKGFTTAAIISAFVLDAKFGLNQGFDDYQDRFEEPHELPGAVNERKGGETTRLALQWLTDHRDQRFFLFLHYFDPHADYAPPEPYASRFADSPYAGEVAYTDHCIGQVIEHLKKLELYDSTLIIITGDHGEMLDEHGESEHGYFIYESAIKVPLVFKLPGKREAKRIEEYVGLVDITPTICDLLSVQPPEHVEGISLAPYLFGRTPEGSGRALYCESLTATRYGANSLLGLVEGSWKYIHTTRSELYDLRSDPAEAKNRVDSEPERARAMRKQLRQRLEARKLSNDDDSESALVAGDIQRLQALGYVGAASTDDAFKFSQGKEDPKDLLTFYRAEGRLAMLIFRENYDQARSLCKELLEQRPTFVGGYVALARIARAQQDHATALQALTHAIDLQPNKAETHGMLGTVLAERGNVQAAIREYARALELNPDSAEAHLGLGTAHLSQARTVEAIRYLQEAVRIDPKLAQAHNRLGDALRSLGQSDEAIRHYREALAFDPNLAEAHYNLGSVLAARRESNEAIVHLRRAVSIRPDYGQAHNHLGIALVVTGQLEKALVHFRAAARLEPSWMEPLNATAWILATHPNHDVRRPEEAVRLAERAVALSRRQHAGALDTLAAALAANGQFERASTAAESALGLAQLSGAQEFVAEVRARLDLYRRGKPYIRRVSH